MAHAHGDSSAFSGHHTRGLKDYYDNLYYKMQPAGIPSLLHSEVKESFPTDGVGSKNCLRNQPSFNWGRRVNPIHPLSDQVFEQLGS